MFEELHGAGILETGAELSTEQATGAMSCTVLLAEDGIDIQLLISTHLTRAGARVTIADNGRVALELALAAALAKEPFDVILMDMQMPQMDGYAATSELRRNGYTGPIVALTAHAMAGDRDRCLGAGCTDYLTKPIGRGKLVGTVAEHARRAKPRSTSHDTVSGHIVSELARDEEMTELVERFTAGLPAQARRLDDALDENDRETIRRVAHQLKGAAGGYGYPSITLAAARLEQSAREGAPVAQPLAEVCDLCRRARANEKTTNVSTRAA
jgi:CheY-like chemotaxis protein